MVNQNHIIYINKNKILKTQFITIDQTPAGNNLSFSINEQHLICGLILKGIPIKGDRLKDFPFTSIEKYLFEFSNIHFFIANNEFKTENQNYCFLLPNIQNIIENPVIPEQYDDINVSPYPTIGSYLYFKVNNPSIKKVKMFFYDINFQKSSMLSIEIDVVLGQNGVDLFPHNPNYEIFKYLCFQINDSQIYSQFYSIDLPR